MVVPLLDTHSTIHVQPLLDVLRSRGYQSRAIVLRSVTTHLPRPTWDDEVSHIHDEINQELENGRDVILLLHSYAGIPGTEALNRLVKADDSQAQHHQGRLLRVIFFSAHNFPTAFVVDAKKMIGPANPQFSIDKDDMLLHGLPYEEFFAPDMGRQEAQVYVEAIRPAYYIDGGGAISSEDWKTVPRTIIGCTHDAAIEKEMQEAMWSEHPEEIVWLETGHSPFAAKPEQIADALLAEL
ncbi:Putative alpha/beta hydrolase-1 [Septoria linicola]|uniref:Alpha/beta hydrolase-1 n=1 Tax=Septoria linicola TaxID=215465 RepID=A0A9Q9ADE9_9PEZI|nr:Putative alpha/beta hydrolase-1 [Septoria linicola]